MDTLTTEAPITILMLHGYGQSGGFFEIKTRPLVRRLTKTLAAHYNTSEDNFRFVFPDGHLHLLDGLKPTASTADTGIVDSSADMRAWTPFYSFSDSTQYAGLERTLSGLSQLCATYGPFSGVVGFSQGAAIAAMFTSWCESNYVPGRVAALQNMRGSQASPALAQIFSRPPQRPLDFALFFSGFAGNAEFYDGFYTPMIVTPSVHVLGRYDTFIPRQNSLELVRACCDAVVVEHQGTHYVPRDPILVEGVIRGLSSVLSLAALKSSLHLTPSSSASEAPSSSASTAGDESIAAQEHLAQTNLHLSNVETPLTREQFHTHLSKRLDMGSEDGSSDSDGSRQSWRSGRSGGRRIVRRYRLAHC